MSFPAHKVASWRIDRCQRLLQEIADMLHHADPRQEDLRMLRLQLSDMYTKLRMEIPSSLDVDADQMRMFVEDEPE